MGIFRADLMALQVHELFTVRKVHPYTNKSHKLLKKISILATVCSYLICFTLIVETNNQFSWVQTRCDADLSRVGNCIAPHNTPIPEMKKCREIIQ